ncbi:MAG: HAD-IA family hydrolase [Terriglobia bacterium]
MGQNFDLLVFDLDGTLIDSRIDLANSVNFTRQQMGLPTLPHDLIFSYIGDGAALLIRRALGEGLNEEAVKTALHIFLDHYRQHLLDHTVLYPEVDNTLQEFSSCQLAVLSNKPVELSVTILEGLNIGDRFVRIYGGDSFEQKKPHPMGIEQILKETRISRQRTLMVGDSKIDVATGENARVATCAVTYGLASETLKGLQPDFLIHQFSELLDIVNPILS